MMLVPAYGRDYKSKKEVLADFNANKDFLVCDFFHPSDGKPINRQQITGTVQIRYARKTKVVVVKV